MELKIQSTQVIEINVGLFDSKSVFMEAVINRVVYDGNKMRIFGYYYYTDQDGKKELISKRVRIELNESRYNNFSNNLEYVSVEPWEMRQELEYVLFRKKMAQDNTGIGVKKLNILKLVDGDWVNYL